MKYIRHGDLLIEKIDSIPEGLPLKGNSILLEGEITNHFHKLKKGKVFTIEPTRNNNYNLGYFELDSITPLTHEEHKTIELQPGKYKFYQQREWDELEERRVQD